MDLAKHDIGPGRVVNLVFLAAGATVTVPHRRPQKTNPAPPHGPAFGGRARRVVSDHAGGFPIAGQHDFRGGRAARRQFGREPDPPPRLLAQHLRPCVDL